MQARRPFWLEEAYQSAIAMADTGLLERNYRLTRRVAPLLYFLGKKDRKFIDIAGGYGAFTRLMRDIGFDFYWSDPYCENLLARGFESQRARPPFAAVTAFEVLEHVADPLQFIRRALSESGTTTFICSTVLFDGSPPSTDWWYYVFDTGQHISFYQHRTLRTIADSLGLYLHSSADLHMMSQSKISHLSFRFMTGRYSNLLLSYVRRKMASKTFADHEAMLNEGAPVPADHKDLKSSC